MRLLNMKYQNINVFLISIKNRSMGLIVNFDPYLRIKGVSNINNIECKIAIHLPIRLPKQEWLVVASLAS